MLSSSPVGNNKMGCQPQCCMTGGTFDRYADLESRQVQGTGRIMIELLDWIGGWCECRVCGHIKSRIDSRKLDDANDQNGVVLERFGSPSVLNKTPPTSSAPRRPGRLGATPKILSGEGGI